MKTASYTQRKNYVQFDENHTVLYLNEQPCEIPNEETGESVSGFSYTGNMPDGGTLIETKDVTDDNRRAKFVAGLIGTEYDIDAQIAILVNGDDTNEHADEHAAFLETRRLVKQSIDELLARNI